MKSNITAIKTNINKPCDIQLSRPNQHVPLILNNEPIEQGTDPLDPMANLKSSDSEDIKVLTEEPKQMKPKSYTGEVKMRNGVPAIDSQRLKQKRKSRSVCSFTDEEKTELKDVLGLGSDPALNLSIEKVKKTADELDVVMLPESVEDRQSEFLQKWLDSGPALVCSEENLYPEEILGTAEENLLTVRTDALVNTKSFNLVKPKF